MSNAKKSKEPKVLIPLSNKNCLQCFLNSNINCSNTGNFLTIDSGLRLSSSAKKLTFFFFKFMLFSQLF